MSAGDVGAERDVQAGAKRPAKQNMRDVYCGLTNINILQKGPSPTEKN